MRQYLSSLVIVLLGVACGGSTGTDFDEPNSAGTSAGGSATAGSNQGQGGSANAGTAGKASAGSSSGGTSSGGNVSVAGFGGVIVTAGTSSGGISSGGTGVVDPDCPAHVPMGACSADDANLACQYDPASGCLCYPSAPGTFFPCQKVDPTCTFMATPAAAPPPDAGSGGFSAKVALPPHQICRCLATTWSCTFGI